MKEQIIIGKYIDGYVWINFDNNTRKFYEKSYYGRLFNQNKQEIRDILGIVEYNNELEEYIISEKNMGNSENIPYYIVLEPLEALYLVENEKLKVILEDPQDNNIRLNFNELIKKYIDKYPKFWTLYIIYRNLRKRGYIVRVGYGGRSDFRVYKRGTKFGKDSAKFIYSILEDGIPIGLNELDSLINQVLNDRKDLVLAIVDKLGDPIFYKLEQFNFKKIRDFDDLWNKSVKLNFESCNSSMNINNNPDKEQNKKNEG